MFASIPPPPGAPHPPYLGFPPRLSRTPFSEPLPPHFTVDPSRIPSPSAYTEGLLGLKLYPWQRDVLEWYDLPRTRVLGALSTPNGAGKTSCIVAGLAFWWLTAHPTGRVVITTKDGKQLEQQLLPAFQRFRVRVPGWTWSHSGYTEITNLYGGRLVAFTTNDAGRVEGWHKGANDHSPLLVIVDEAKSVAEEIFQAIDRCTFNSLLYVSSPGLMLGTFFNAFTRNAALFRRCQVGARDCPHIPPDRIAGVIAKYGADHPLTRSTIEGEFMDQDATSSFVFHLRMLQRVLVRDQRPPAPHRDRSAFCDFAAGGDENVLAIRDGDYVRVAAAWRDPDTAAAATRFIREFHAAGLKPDEIFADEGGLGRPMVDHLAILGWRINRVNFGAKAYDSAYENRRGGGMRNNGCGAHGASRQRNVARDSERRQPRPNPHRLPSRRLRCSWLEGPNWASRRPPRRPAQLPAELAAEVLVAGRVERGEQKPGSAAPAASASKAKTTSSAVAAPPPIALMRYAAPGPAARPFPHHATNSSS